MEVRKGINRNILKGMRNLMKFNLRVCSLIWLRILPVFNLKKMINNLLVLNFLSRVKILQTIFKKLQFKLWLDLNNNKPFLFLQINKINHLKTTNNNSNSNSNKYKKSNSSNNLKINQNNQERKENQPKNYPNYNNNNSRNNLRETNNNNHKYRYLKYNKNNLNNNKLLLLNNNNNNSYHIRLL